MIESWREQMHIGLVHPMAYPGVTNNEELFASLEEVCRDTFFDVLEVKPTDSATHARIKAIADQAAVRLIVAGQPPLLGGKLNLNNPDEAGRRAAIDCVKASLDAAYEMNARLCAVLSGPDPGEADRAQQVDLLVASLVECCQYAQAQARDYVVWVTLETFDYNIDKRCLVGPSALAREVARRVRESVDNFGLTIDLSHLPLLGESPADCVEQIGDYLIHVHAGNCAMQDPAHAAYGDVHPRFGMLGSENDVPQLKEFIETLIYSGYFKSDVPTEKPVFTFEVKPLPGESTQLILAGTARTFQRAWAEIGS
ncbi:MAG TPA: TIM barrel protein [Armatimonadota bacterium]|jgi:sugar phosphate isomerase/epimerase